MMGFDDGVEVGPVDFVDEVVVSDFPQDDEGVGEVVEFCFYAVEAGVAPFCQFHCLSPNVLLPFLSIY